MQSFSCLIVGSVLAALTYGFFNLIAIWAGLSQRHWSIRLSILGLALATLLALPAPVGEQTLKFQPFLDVGCGVSLIFVVLSLWRIIKYRSIGFLKLKLSDLILALTFVSVFFRLATWLPQDALPWRPFEEYIPSACFAASAIVASWAALSRSGAARRFVVLVILLPTIAFLPFFVDKLLPLSIVGLFWQIVPDEWLIAAIAIHGCLLASYLQLGRFTCHFRTSQNVRWSHLIRAGQISFTAAVLIPLGLTYYALVKPYAVPHSQIPNPNGYDLLARAGEETDITWLPFRKEQQTPEQCRRFVQQNSRALELADAAIGIPSCVPLMYGSLDDTYPTKYSNIRRLCRGLCIRARLEATDGNIDKSLHTLLDVMRIARQSGTGGVLIHRLNARGIEQLASNQLSVLIPKLTTDQQRHALASLLSSEKEWEPHCDVLVRDRIYSALGGGWRHRLYNSLEYVSGDIQRYANADHKIRAEFRLLICAVAIQIFLADEGRLPERLDELAPGWLPQVPEDPYDGTQIKFRIQPSGYVLYCVGQNRRDDHGIEGFEESDLPVLVQRFEPNEP